jgi:hypothetical protein
MTAAGSGAVIFIRFPRLVKAKGSYWKSFLQEILPHRFPLTENHAMIQKSGRVVRSKFP